MRDARYIEIPGSRTHELPPLLVHSAAEHAPVEDMESVLGEAEDMLAVSDASPDILRAAPLRAGVAIERTVQRPALALALGRFHPGVDPPMRDHIRMRRHAPQAITSGRVAARQPREFRHAADGKGRADPRRRTGEGGRTAALVPPAAADRLLLEPVPVLFELDGGRTPPTRRGRT